MDPDSSLAFFFLILSFLYHILLVTYERHFVMSDSYRIKNQDGIGYLARLPEVLQETFRMPPFPMGDVPTEAEITRSNDWLLSKGLIDAARSYDEVVNTEFTK